MQMNHHILAKTTTESVLSHFKDKSWVCHDDIGPNFFRISTSADFPSPDATFYDDENNFSVSFEFKPPTETKRGVLTGVGQSIAYLRENNASYLIAPQKLDDYNLGDFLTDLFNTQISGKIPTGLILYENDHPENVNLAVNINAAPNDRKYGKRDIDSRYWAKYQDLPIPLFHLLLHCYFLKKTHAFKDDAFKYCWQNYMISKKILEDFKPQFIYDCLGQPIKTPAGTKEMVILEKELKKIEKLPLEEKRECIRAKIDTNCTGDNMFNSWKKNFTSFLKNLKVIDSAGEITDAGFKLYHLGLVNGPNSRIFTDYFAREVLMTGYHLDLILDLDKVIRENPKSSFTKCRSQMECQYEEKGFIKRNPNRKAKEKSKARFLKQEAILWKRLGLLEEKSKDCCCFNWKRITEICSLSDL